MTTELIKLNALERGQLRALETTIEKSVSTFMLVGGALKEIRDSRLYREQYKTFEKYVSERWGFKKTYAYDLISSNATAEKMSAIADKTPEVKSLTSESQLRELGNVPDDKLGEVVEKAAVKASDEGKPITARHIKAAKQEILAEPEQEPEIEPATEELSVVEMALKNASVGKECLRAISAAMKAVKDAIEAPGTEMLVVRKKSIINDLQNARNAVSATIPVSACPRCGGSGCKQCGNHGWVNSVLAKELSA